MTCLYRKRLVVVLAFVLALPASGQALIEQAPADSALYIAWRGTDDLGPGYEGSNLQGVLRETGLLDAVPELTGLIQQLGEDGLIEEDDAQIIGVAGTLLASMWSGGGAVYMLAPDPEGPPIPRLCLMWQTGQDQDALRDAINTVVAMLEEQVPVFSGETDETLYLSIGFDPAEIEAAPLATSQRYQAAAKNVQDDAALMVYVDVGLWIKQIDDFAAMMRDQAADQGQPAEPFAEMWPRVRGAVGLEGLESLALSAGFEAENWHTQLFIGARSPRRGVLSLLDHEVIAPESLMHIPKSATYAQALSMQPSRVLDVVIDAAGKIDERYVDVIKQALDDASEAVGFDLEMKLIRGMGPLWTVYVDPMIAGNGFASIVLVNELQDPDSVKQAMVQLSDKANELLADVDEDIKIRFLTKEIGGAAVTHLGIPFVAPAWMVHDGKLYVSLYPQALEMATEQTGKREDSILANTAFQSAMSRFLDGPDLADAGGKAFENLKPVTGLSFANLPETAADGYGMNMMIMQIATGLSEMFTGEASSVRMPPVGKILPYLEVSGGITRVSDDGLHLQLIEPFPGATLLSASKGLTSGAGLSAPVAVGILLPALGAARRTARIMQTTTQARQVSLANFNYAADHGGVFAEDLAQLEGYLGDVEVLISPRSIRPVGFPFNFEQLPDAQRAQRIRQISSFVLVPVGEQNRVRNPAGTVMLFERPDDAGVDELVVAMVDGSSTRMPIRELEGLLRRQTGQSIQQLIRRQENFGE
ncbi:MAG: hypothetical protein AAGI37_13445 [Planctomycetota bacterium]